MRFPPGSLRGNLRRIERMPAVGAANQCRRSILVVDDNPFVRQFITRALEQGGYASIAACDGLQARDLFHRHAPELALLWVELALPRVTGAEFISTLPTLEPRIPVVFTNGRADLDVPAELPGPVLPKPFGAADLRRILRDHALPLSFDGRDNRRAT